MDIRRPGNKPGATHARMPAKATFDIRKPQPRPPQKSPLGPVPQITPEPTPEVTLEPSIVVEEAQVTPPVLEMTTKEVPDVIDDAAKEPEPQTKEKPASSTKKTVEIKISLPVMPGLRPITQHRAYTATRMHVAKLSRKTKLIGGTMIAITLISLAGYYWLNGNNTTTATGSQSTDAKPDLVYGTPRHKIILPQGKTIKSFSGSSWVSPADRPPVFVYVDTINSSAVNVSQQPLPDTFKPDIETKIAQLATSFKATEKVTVGNSTVHIGTSDNGSQSLLFHKDDLLVSITSKARLDNSQWIQYINSLQ